ncbi:MAG: acyl-CoA dehydrogenase family protein [Candidatus Sericytochromatia bacterium]
MGFDFAYTDEQKMVQESITRMLKRHEDKHVSWRQDIYKHHSFPDALWQAFAETGIMGSFLPEAYGGSDMGLMPLLLALETLSAHGFASVHAVVTAMDALCLLKHGSEELKQRILPKVATGEMRLGYAHTEPDAGSNVFNTATFAKREGDHYVVNGQKVFISGVDSTQKLLLVTRTTSLEDAIAQGNRTYGLTLMLVDCDSPGLEKQFLPLQGLEGIKQWAIFFENMKVPVENVVGIENGGAQIIFDSLNSERILAAGIATGMVDFLLDRSTRYARERKVFGNRAIGSYQAIAHPLAETKIEQEAARLLTYRAAWAFDKGLPPAEVGHFANLAKFKAADVAIKAADHAIETHGGYGFSEEYEVIYYWNTARLFKTAPITREMILNFISEHSLKLPRSY